MNSETFLGRLLREPLFHFLFLGALIFVAFAVLDDTPEAVPADVVTVTEADVAASKQQFEGVWRRQPNEDELGAILDDLVRGKVLTREATKLGMDQNDTLIDRRLRQKMEFFITSAVNSVEPDDSELEAYVAANADRFSRDAMTAFDQIYLGEAPSEEEVSAALEALQGGADPAGLGTGTMLPPRVDLSAPRAIDAAFGRDFAASLAELPLEEWSGPVRSGFGQHLVRVTERTEQTLLPLDEVRDRALAEWQSEKSAELLDAYYEEIRKRYTIVLPESMAGTDQ